jgi:hypothetical protein
LLCKRLAARKKREEAKAKEKDGQGSQKKEKKKEKKDIYAAKFQFIFKIQKREVIFSSMEHCRIRLTPLCFYLIYSPSFLATISNHTCTS